MMANTILLPLRSTHREPTWGSLETRVRQIEFQKGSFRSVTEESLLEDIEKVRTGNAEVLSDSEDSEEDESPESKQKKLWAARDEMIKQILRAQNETLTALDSISLLVSKYPKTQALAKLSMSPALLSAVPDSTLDAQKVRTIQSSTSVKQKSELLYLGYKLDGLNKAIEKINSARARLNAQAKQESNFWKQVADIAAEGLVVSRLPRDSRTIGVHFGFSEAAPRFRNRGFAVLRTDQDGQLRLDQNITLAKRYSVQVTTFREDRITGRSRASTDRSTDMTLAATVASLRRSLFEEELFFEIGREARAIANQGVAIIGNTITSDIIGDQRMEIELVDHDERLTRTESKDDEMADAIVLCLRSLLSKGHEQTLARRSQPPVPLMLKTSPIPEYALLRPLLSHMRQQSIVSVLKVYCDSMKATLNSAGLAYSVVFSSTMSIEHDGGEHSHQKLFSDALLAPADTSINISLPTNRNLEVNVRTHLAPPAFGTIFIASPIEYQSDQLTPPKMSNVDAAKSALRHVLATDIVELICDMQSSEDGIDRGWTSSGRYSGELKCRDSSMIVRVMDTDLGPSLGLRYLKWKDPAASETEQTWVWQGTRMLRSDAGTRKSQETKQLVDVVKDLLGRPSHSASTT